MHGDPCTTQQRTRLPVGADGLHDHRLELRCDDVRHHPGGGNLERGELGGLSGVGAEVPGDEHAVNLLAREQRGHRSDVGHRVPLPRARQVDRVGHRGTDTELSAQQDAGLLGEHRCLQADRGQGVTRDRAVPTTVGEDRGVPPSHPTTGEQSLQQIGHLRGVVDPMSSRRNAGCVDHLIGAGQRSGVGDGAADGSGGAARRHQHDRLAHRPQSSSHRDEGASVHDVLGVDPDSARGLVVEAGRHQVHHRQVGLVPQRDEPRDPESPILQQSGEVEHHVAALAQHRHLAHRQQVVGQLEAGAGVHQTQAVRPDEHRAARAHQTHHLLLHPGTVGSELGEAGGDHHHGPGSGLDRGPRGLHELVRGNADDDQVQRFTQLRSGLHQRAVRTASQHFGSTAVHQQHRPLPAGLEGAPGEDVPPLRRVGARADHRDRTRVEQGGQRPSGRCCSAGS